MASHSPELSNRRWDATISGVGGLHLKRDASKVRLTIVQYAGDYREAVHRFASGGQENYYAQKYSVNAVSDIAQYTEETTVICCMTDKSYDEYLPNGIRAIGAGFQTGITNRRQVDLLKLMVAAQRPTHLIMRSPIQPIFRWAVQNKVRTIGIFADSFNNKSWRNRLRHFSLAQTLNHDAVEWVFNHGIASSESLQAIGVRADKIIPWDWPAIVTPDLFPAKTLKTSPPLWNLFYAGLIIDSKGVGDLINAVSLLRSRQIPVQLNLAGKGDIDHYTDLTKRLNIQENVNFLGMVPNKQIVQLMREADVVIVPSRPEYPEGLPMTIYESLCSRTPLVASDHPMFARCLQHRKNAMVFPAGDAIALARCLEDLLKDAQLYASISAATEATWQQLQIPVKWADMIQYWLNDSAESQEWLSKHSLARFY